MKFNLIFQKTQKFKIIIKLSAKYKIYKNTLGMVGIFVKSQLFMLKIWSDICCCFGKQFKSKL